MKTIKQILTIMGGLVIFADIIALLQLLGVMKTDREIIVWKGSLEIILLLAIAIGLFILAGKDPSFRQKKGYSDIKTINKTGKLEPIYVTGLILQDEEAAFFSYPGYLVKASEKVIGSKSVSSGIGASLGGGASYHTGSRTSKIERGRVETTIPGKVVFTNKRMLFISPDSGFEGKLSDISSINRTGLDDTTILLKRRNIHLSFDHEKICDAATFALRALVNTFGADDTKKEASTSKKRNYSPAKELQRLKALLDDGIISEEEFLSQKRSILGSGTTTGKEQVSLHSSHTDSDSDSLSAKDYTPLIDNSKPVLNRAIDLVATTQDCSLSILQRTFGISSREALALIEEMQECGIIGDLNDLDHYPVMLSKEQYQSMTAYKQED